MPDSASLNRFATAVTHRFSEAARGTDDESDRFVKTRPAERILAGFLTPVDNSAANPAGAAVVGNDPDVPIDESYEQSHIGFEWAVPRGALGQGLRIEVRVSFHVYVRLIPSFQEARDNARTRGGVASLVEVWQRFHFGGDASAGITETINLDDLFDEGSIVKELGPRVAALWQPVGSTRQDLFVWRSEQSLTPQDIADNTSYASWLQQLRRPVNPEILAWKPQIDVRAFVSPTEPNSLRVLLRLVNRSDSTDRRREAYVDPRLYAVRLAATVPSQAHTYSEFRSLENSYRYDRRIAAIGINSQPVMQQHGGVVTLTADTVPIVPTPRLMPREIPGGTPHFVDLADRSRSLPLLNVVLEAMEEYDRTAWADKLAALPDAAERRDAEDARSVFRAEIRAFRAGVELLSAEPESDAAAAFRYMNSAMARAGRSRRRSVTRWHLFQIVFIVSQLPSLVSAAEGSGESGPLRILWFPAGGGKTEAFLGLILWHAFYDRLRGKSIGVTALLRYPLRLLTYQQLQRVAWVLGQAEEERLAVGLGGEPFSLGYYVGQSTTPNSISDQQHRELAASGVPSSWQRVFRCPSCGARQVRLRYQTDLRLVEHYCASPTCRTRGDRLPIYVVDDDLYRYLPTIVVSTVDKLAQLGQNRRFAQLLGRIEFYCPKHGAAYRGSNARICAASDDARQGRFNGTCAGDSVVTGPFTSPGPSLHVQDEMHLLREALATFDSHYETTALALQDGINPGAGWALIGATATIAGYREQAAHLYLRDVNRFPGPGPEAYESFYYTVDPNLIGRIFVGVLGVGRTHTPSVARTMALLYAVIERARALATQSLPAARTFVDLPNASSDDICELAFLYEIVLSYVLTRKGGDQVSEAVDTRVRSEIENITGAPLRVETFNGNVEMPQMISVMEEIEAASDAQPLGERVRGVVATNVISHGVDVDRFNVMVFAGLPRQFAEYIQASARVGRHLPGISVLVITPQSERDRSVFDRFEKCHQYVDRLVEPVPVNRWSEPALELTLPGVVAAYLMGLVPIELGSEIYTVNHVQSRFGLRGADALDQDRVTQWVVKAVGANAPEAPADFARVVENLAGRLYGKVTGAARDAQNETLNSYLGAMRSLRDIDEPAWIALLRDADKQLIRTLGM